MSLSQQQQNCELQHNIVINYIVSFIQLQTSIQEQTQRGAHCIMDNIEAWKEVHNHLVVAIALTKDAINVEKAKRRFMLEELYTHLTPDGTSLWIKNTSKKSTTRKRKASDLEGSKSSAQQSTSNSNKSSSASKKKRKTTKTSAKKSDDVGLSETATTREQSQPLHILSSQVTKTDENKVHAERSHDNSVSLVGNDTIATDDNVDTPSSQSHFPYFSPSSQQDQAGSFFNNPISYSVLDANAIDAAAAVASALTASLVPTNSQGFDQNIANANN